MAKQIEGGLLVVVEGIDGAGKTTLVANLASQLAGLGWDVETSKEPTQGPHGQTLRASAATGRLTPERELELLLADRKEHIDTLVGPALRRGAIVILDRYYFSNVAYQGAAGLDPKELLEVNERFAPPADVVLLLDLPEQVGLSRIRSRGDYPNKFEVPKTLKRARQIFLDTIQPRGYVVDATASPETVQSLALGFVMVAVAHRIIKDHGLSKAGVNHMLEAMGSAPLPLA